MRNVFLNAAVALAAGLMFVGCKSDSDGMSDKSMSKDVCTHCPGDQKATADGKCEACGMKVSMTDAKDCCKQCPGSQTLTADGKCSACGGKVM